MELIFEDRPAIPKLFKRSLRHQSWAKDRLRREVTSAETLLCEGEDKMTSLERHIHGNIILCMWASFEVSHSLPRLSLLPVKAVKLFK